MWREHKGGGPQPLNQKSPYQAPSTMSFNALAGVKRSRVRAGILIASPVAGLRPIRALLLRLRKIPRPAKRSEPSFLSSRTTRPVNSSSVLLACFFVRPAFSARVAATCDCVIILLLAVRHCRIARKTAPVTMILQVRSLRLCPLFLGIEQDFQQAMLLEP